jgi:hypothetical protein
MYYHFEIQIEKEEIIENGMVDKKGRKIGLKIITGMRWVINFFSIFQKNLHFILDVLYPMGIYYI